VWRFGTVSGEVFVLPEVGLRGVEVFSRAAHGVEGRHVTPERELRSNLRLLAVNLLKTKRLRDNPSDPVAVEQPQVNERELVDSFRWIAHHRRTVETGEQVTAVSADTSDTVFAEITANWRDRRN
jgi:hypothetical protein